MRPQVCWPVFSLQLTISLLLLTVSAAAQQAVGNKPVWAPELPDASAPGLRPAGPECVLQNADGCVRMLFAAEKNNKWGFIDNSGKAVVPLTYDEVFAFSEGLAPVKLGKKLGFVDATGNLVIPASWEFVQPFHQGLAAVTDGKKYGFIDKTGKVVIPPQFAWVGNFHEGLAAVGIVTHPPSKMYPNAPHIPDAFGYIDTNGQMVIPLAHSDGHGVPMREASVMNGRVSFEANGKWGAMDTTGKIVIEPQYRGELKFSQGLAEVSIDGKTGYIDTDGKIVVPAIYEQERRFFEGLAAVRSGGRWGFVNTSGQLAVPIKFDQARDFHGGFAAVVVDGKWGIIDNTGKMVVAPQFETSMSCPTARDPSAVSHPSAPEFSEGLAAVSVQCKWGFVDMEGHMAIPATLDEVNDFSEGLAAARSGSKWGFIDKSGHFIIPAQYDNVSEFSGGLAKVYVNIKRGFESSLINPAGKIIWGPEIVKGLSPWLLVPIVPLIGICLVSTRCIV